MKLKILLLIPILILMTGCWDYNELNTLAIVTGIAIDKDTNNNLEVSLLIANSKKSESSSTEGEAQTIVYTGKGESIPEALKQIDLISPKKLYLGHLSVAVISEEIAKEGLSSISDFLLREPESIKRFYIILAKDTKAENVLKILSPLESFPSQSIYQNIQISSDAQAISLAVPYSTFIENMLKKGKNAVIPSITIEGDIEEGSNSESLGNSEPKAMTKIDTTGVFKKDKLIGFVSEDASRGISLLENHTDLMVTTTECKNGKVVANLTTLKTKKTATKEEATIKITGSAYLKDVSCSLNLSDIEVIDKIEKQIEDKIKYFIEKALKETQEYQTDVFGFGNLIYKSNPKYFNSIKNKWDADLYPNLKPKIKIDIKLMSKGSIEKTVKEAINEK